MAGFQVANFSFGKNIKDDERQRAIASMNNATTRRGQDMQAAQADANRAENARQFDAQMAEREAQREEGARQFDTVQNLKERQHAESRADIERAQSWDDAIKLQQMEKEAQELENRRLAFDERNAKLDAFLRIKQEEDEQMENRRAAMESSYGNMAIVTQLQNGVVTRKQVDAFNKELLENGMIEEGREYNYIGTIDQTTGKPFSDGKLHFVRYALDGNGRVQMDPKSGRPLVEIDNPLNAEIRNSALTSYFGDVKEFMGKGRGGMSEERMQLENSKLDMREKELEARKNQAAMRNKEMQTRLAASIARNFNSVRSGAGFDEESSKAFRQGLQNVLSDMFGLTQADGGEENPTGQPHGEQQGQARQISSPSEMADAPVGSWFVKGDKKYIKQENGQFLPEE